MSLSALHFPGNLRIRTICGQHISLFSEICGQQFHFRIPGSILDVPEPGVKAFIFILYEFVGRIPAI